MAIHDPVVIRSKELHVDVTFVVLDIKVASYIIGVCGPMY